MSERGKVSMTIKDLLLRSTSHMELMMEDTSDLEPVEQGEAAYPDSAYGSSPVDTDTEDGITLSSSTLILTYNEELMHKTILVGDSGVGKTSLLVQFDQGKFIPGSFSATVGIGFTVMLLGDSAVGKTCILVRFKDGAFLGGNFIATVGIDFRNKVVTVDNMKVKLQMWDTAGQERFRSVTHAYYRDAQALLLLYDITRKSSFDNIRAWLTEIYEYAQKDVVIMLLGNKSDMAAERVITHEEGEKLAKEYGVPFMETSAKTGVNVELAFHAIARELKHRNIQQPHEPKFKIHDYIESEKQKSNCCGGIM
uniref:small monomeric GTPase n=1 Tax=Cyprinus carpio carpio TaxID=630221 RepID=A0A9J8DFL8_CYPCA